MNDFTSELRFANYHNLVLAQKMLSDQSFSSRHILGLTKEDADFIISLTPSDLQKLSQLDVMLFSFRYTSSLEVLRQFIAGDELSATHLHMISFSKNKSEQGGAENAKA